MLSVWGEKIMNKTSKLLVGFIQLTFGPLSIAQDQPIRQFYLLGSNEAPARWANPVVPAFYDETGLHAEQFEQVATLAQFYAIVADAYPAKDEVALPSIGYVVADEIFDPETEFPDHKMHSALAEKLYIDWADTPLEEAIGAFEFRIAVNGVFDGSDCVLFIAGSRQNEPIKAFQFSASVIVAKSDLEPRKVLQCFYNKTAVSFGFGVSNFDFERQYDVREDGVLYHGSYLAVLYASDWCRNVDAAGIFNCIDWSFRNSIDFAAEFVERVSLDESSYQENTNTDFDLGQFVKGLGISADELMEFVSKSPKQFQVLSNFYTQAYNGRFETGSYPLPKILIDGAADTPSASPDYILAALYFAAPLILDAVGFCKGQQIQHVTELEACTRTYVLRTKNFYLERLGPQLFDPFDPN